MVLRGRNVCVSLEVKHCSAIVTDYPLFFLAIECDSRSCENGRVVLRAREVCVSQLREQWKARYKAFRLRVPFLQYLLVGGNVLNS